MTATNAADKKIFLSMDLSFVDPDGK